MCSASRPSSHAAETASVKKGAPEMTRLREEASFPRAAQAFQDVPQLAGGERGNRQEHHCLRDGRNGEDTTASLKLCDDQSLDTKSSFVNRYICILQPHVDSLAGLCGPVCPCQLGGSCRVILSLLALRPRSVYELQR